MITAPLTAEQPLSPSPGDSPNSRFLAGDVPQGADQKVRFGNAFGFSMGAHVGIFFLALFIASRLPAIAPTPLANMETPDIVWLDQPGPGGGGGGGNKMPDPPRKAEAVGKQKITVPAAKPPKIDNPAPPKEIPPQPQLTIPAVNAASGITEMPGALSGLPSAPSTGSGTGVGAGPGTGSGLGPGSGGGTGGGVYRPGSGIVSPKVLQEVKPAYTADAMRAKIQGTVWIEAVVMPDGSVGNVHITRSLDPTFGLDQEAIKAVKRWRFIPGTRRGEAVPVLVEIELTFTLR
jgi:periplasmic protein TonB